MKANAALFLIFVVEVTAQVIAYSAPSIPKGSRFVSPDHRYSVELEEIGRLTYFAITDTEKRTVDKSVIMPSLLLYLHWAPNSRSFVTVEHIPHGSLGRLVYLVGDTWRDLEIRAPGEELKDQTVITLRINNASARFRFAVRYLKPDGMPLRYGFCDLDVALNDGKISNVQCTSASEADWAATIEQNPSYMPEMESGRARKD